MDIIFADADTDADTDTDADSDAGVMWVTKTKQFCLLIFVPSYFSIEHCVLQTCGCVVVGFLMHDCVPV